MWHVCNTPTTSFTWEFEVFQTEGDVCIQSNDRNVPPLPVQWLGAYSLSQDYINPVALLPL